MTRLNEERCVFVVLCVTNARGAEVHTSVVGVYDHFGDADAKRAEQPLEFALVIAPYYPSPPMEP